MIAITVKGLAITTEVIKSASGRQCHRIDEARTGSGSGCYSPLYCFACLLTNQKFVKEKGGLRTVSDYETALSNNHAD